jgi:hypothetical protein
MHFNKFTLLLSLRTEWFNTSQLPGARDGNRKEYGFPAQVGLTYAVNKAINVYETHLRFSSSVQYRNADTANGHVAGRQSI